MVKQSFFSLALSFALLTGAVVTAVGQTTNTMPTQSSGSSTMSGSQTSTSGMGSMSGSSMGMSTNKDLAASAGLSPAHSTLLKALQATGLADQAKGTGPFTVFAPTNDAFNKLPSATLAGLMKPSMKKQLTNILATHVVPGNVMAADLTDGQTLKTVNGETLTVSKQGDTVMIKDSKGGSATVTTPDIKATNGVVHSIDTVLMPSKM